MKIVKAVVIILAVLATLAGIMLVSCGLCASAVLVAPALDDALDYAREAEEAAIRDAGEDGGE